ncbi:LysR family transcriptional regulator [Glaciibacter psychrotolerans]|uniref:DNA-binding transcriptional LysR family regulator n=1 Tax=Glaciibacter psychrotolerans TaxID=670054 RepID=A0A7Z0EBN3_9MICO|nr:LysR family transcriptional regulator [Leifsonia psychrotolerans]NYJ18645.1 DNA-binding transcriptional LysR family regulator [Leifsonia psychrotolerans]
MNLEQLQGFVEVARTGHFTRAATQLHLAQPSLSRQIATLESDLGAQLFHRVRGNITLTAAGESLLPLATRMLADAETVRHEMQELAGLKRGRVRLGATPTLCISLVAEVLASFHAAYPGIDLHLTEGGSRGLLDDLAGGELDLALITASEEGVSSSASLQRIPLVTEELVVISAAQSPLFGTRTSLTLAQLAALPQITFHESYDLRAATMQAFRDASLSPRIVLEGAEMDAVLRCVERGLGVAVVPAMVLTDRPGVRSVRLNSPRLTRSVSLAHRRDVTLTRAAQAMHDMIIDTADILSSATTTMDGLIVRATERHVVSGIVAGTEWNPPGRTRWVD